MKTVFPLQWAPDWPVTTKKTVLKRKRSWHEAQRELESISRKMNLIDPVLSSNYDGLEFKGSKAVSFSFKNHGKEMVIFCDRYFAATDNLWAIVERMRAALLIQKYNLKFYEFKN